MYEIENYYNGYIIPIRLSKWSCMYLHQDLTLHSSFHSGSDWKGFYKSKVKAQETLELYLEKENKMENYMMLEGERIELSDETTKNLKKKFGKKEEIPFARVGKYTCKGDRHEDRLILKFRNDLKIKAGECISFYLKNGAVAARVYEGYIENNYSEVRPLEI